MPELRFFAGDAVDEEIDRLAGEQGRHHLGGQVGAVRRVVGRVHDQGQRREQEVHQLGRVRVVDVRLQFRLKHHMCLMLLHVASLPACLAYFS